MVREGTNGYRTHDPYFLGVIRSLAESAAGSQCTILSLTARNVRCVTSTAAVADQRTISPHGIADS